MARAERRTAGRRRRDDRPRAVLCSDDLATRLEARAAPIAGDVVHLVVGSPASGPAHATAELVADTEGLRGCRRPVVAERATSLRSGVVGTLAGPRSTRERLTDVALSQMIETLDIQAEAIVRCLVAEWSTLSPAGRTVEAYLMSTTLALAAARLSAVTEAYLETCLQRRTGRRSATERHLAEVVANRGRFDRVRTRGRAADRTRLHRRGRCVGGRALVARRGVPGTPGAAGGVLALHRGDGGVVGDGRQAGRPRRAGDRRWRLGIHRRRDVVRRGR